MTGLLFILAIFHFAPKLSIQSNELFVPSEDPLQHLIQGISSIYTDLSCSRWARRVGLFENDSSITESGEQGNFCQFYINPYKYENYRYIRKASNGESMSLEEYIQREGSLQTEFFCKLPESEVCDGRSKCLTDECNCGDKEAVFYCANGLGCIAMGQVCDGIVDCTDHSDECLCEGAVECTWGHCITNPPLLACASPNKYIDDEKCGPAMQGIKNAGPCKDFTQSIETNNILECNEKCNLEIEQQKTNCTKTKRECIEIPRELFKHVLWGSIGIMATFISCPDTDLSIELEKLCDGAINCVVSGIDELYCSGRFYCNKEGANSTWVSPKKVCNNFPDCQNSLDECSGCQKSAISSDLYMIRNKIFLYSFLVIGTVIIALNIFSIRENLATETETSDRLWNDKFIYHHIAFHDSLIGIYMLIIFIKAQLFGDKYCQHDMDWRNSIFCQALGVFFSFSSHGSLIFVALMSYTRYITITSMSQDTLKKKRLICISIMAYILNILHASIPLLPISKITDAFRIDIVFPDNPFISSFNRTRVEWLYETYFNKSSDGMSTRSLLDNLENMTSAGGVRGAMETGFYGYTALCIPNMMSPVESQVPYKITYCVLLGIFLLYIVHSYIRIVLYQRSSSRAAVHAQQPGVSLSALLSFKVAIIIGSQLVCWLSFFILLIIFNYFSSNLPSTLVYEVTAGIIVPLNSVLNPIFYSSLYKNIHLAAVSLIFKKEDQDKNISSEETGQRNEIDAPRELENIPTKKVAPEPGASEQVAAGPGANEHASTELDRNEHATEPGTNKQVATEPGRNEKL